MKKLMFTLLLFIITAASGQKSKIVMPQVKRDIVQQVVSQLDSLAAKTQHHSSNK